jgi:hypothetical protein
MGRGGAGGGQEVNMRGEGIRTKELLRFTKLYRIKGN